MIIGVAVVYAYAGPEIHPPLRMPQKHIPYDPDKIIEITLHEYKRGGNHAEHEVTGRHTDFGIHYRYLAVGSHFHEQVPLQISTWMSWERDEAGEIAFVSVRDENGIAPRSMRGTRIFRSDITSAGTGGPVAGDGLFRGGELNRDPFPGFFSAHSSVPPSRQYYPMEGPYCGFDVFDNTRQRDKGRFLGPGEDPRDYVDEPLSLGRAFAYPAGSDEYTFFVLCRDKGPLDRKTGICRAGGHFNDYIKYRVLFDSSMLCDASDVVDAFDAFLRDYSLEVD